MPSGTGEEFEACNDTVIAAESRNAARSGSKSQIQKDCDFKGASDLYKYDARAAIWGYGLTLRAPFDTMEEHPNMYVFGVIRP
jgi:hypothetical protein